jgi:hypothetical protein
MYVYIDACMYVLVRGMRICSWEPDVMGWDGGSPETPRLVERGQAFGWASWTTSTSPYGSTLCSDRPARAPTRTRHPGPLLLTGGWMIGWQPPGA